MRESFDIRSSIRDYRVTIGIGVARAILRPDVDRKTSIILCDRYFETLIRESGNRYVSIDVNEKAKSLESIPRILEQFREQGCDRGTELCAVGGGVVQDVATLCASLYMRGITWSYVPTTLLGMADSCIGGKSAINVGQYKNLVGNFYPPTEIFVDPEFVTSLSIEQRVAGLCEAAKICYAAGAGPFANFLNAASDTRSELHSFQRIISLSLSGKKGIIERDEFDKGDRLLLNFGHTFGHALEAASGFAISHGVAVGLGMCMAIHLSNVTGNFDVEPSRTHMLYSYLETILTEIPDIKRGLADVRWNVFLSSFLSDKKHRNGMMAIVLINAKGDLVMREVPQNETWVGHVKRSMTEVMKRWE